MTLQLTKIEGGLCSGEAMFSEYGMFIYPCENKRRSRKRKKSLNLIIYMLDYFAETCSIMCLYSTSIFIQLFCYLSGNGGNKKEPGNEGNEKEDGENDGQMEDNDEDDEADNEEDMEESEED